MFHAMLYVNRLGRSRIDIIRVSLSGFVTALLYYLLVPNVYMRPGLINIFVVQ